VYSRTVSELLVAHDGGPLTGHTFTGHTAACAAGVAVQRIVARDGLVARVRSEGEVFRRLLAEALAGLEAVGDIRGRGFFVGVEFVADRDSREPFDPQLQIAARIGRRAAADGLLCYPTPGNIDGVNGDSIILAPPYIATREELAEIAARFAAAAHAVFADRLSAGS